MQYEENTHQCLVIALLFALSRGVSPLKVAI